MTCLSRIVLLGLFGTLAQSATLRGHVRDQLGAAVAGAIVDVIEATGTYSVQTDQAGYYIVSSLRAGKYTLRSKASSGATTFGPFALKSNETRVIDLTVKAAASADVEFSDDPKFVVAGVTDGTYMGGHGSEAGVRSAESLAAATALLKNDLALKVPQSEISLRAALERDPENATLHHSLAAIEEQAGKPLDAAHDFQRAAELSPSELNLFDWGTELLTHSAPQPAAKVFDKGIRLFPRSSRMLLGAAVAFYAQGEYSQAAQLFCQATDLNPADPDPYLFLAKVQSTQISETAAYADRLVRFLKLQPENAWANYYNALRYWDRRNNPEELARINSLLENAVRLDPSLAEANLHLGILASEARDFSGAIGLYQKAIAARFDLDQAHFRLAAAYRKMGEMQQAQRETEIFEQLEKTAAAQHQQERSELKRFIVTLKGSGPDSIH